MSLWSAITTRVDGMVHGANTAVNADLTRLAEGYKRDLTWLRARMPQEWAKAKADLAVAVEAAGPSVQEAVKVAVAAFERELLTALA